VSRVLPFGLGQVAVQAFLFPTRGHSHLVECRHSHLVECRFFDVR